MKKSWSKKYGLHGSVIGPQLLPTNPISRAELLELLETGFCRSSAISLTSTGGGTGKTAYTRALEDTGRYQVIRFTGTSTGVDTINELSETLKHIPLGESWLVIVNEVSEASDSFLKGLRSLIDDCVEEVLFVFTDNFFTVLQTKYKQTFDNSRVINYDFGTPDTEDFENILKEILKVESATVKNLPGIVKASYPDLRQGIKIIERMNENG